jgi:hypothetical protein
MIRRAVATIPSPAIRDMAMAAPHKALFGKPGDPVGFVWLPSGLVPQADSPIAGPMLCDMLATLRANYRVMLIANDRQSRDRTGALLKAALDDERPLVLS